MNNACGDGDEFREGTCATVIAAGNAEHLAIIAEVHISARAVEACAAINCGVESDTIAFGKILHR